MYAIDTAVTRYEGWDVQAASLWNEALFVARNDDKVRETVQVLVIEWISQITQIVQVGQASWDFPLKEKPYRIAHKLLVAVMGLDRLAALNIRQPHSASVHEQVREAITLELGTPKARKK